MRADGSSAALPIEAPPASEYHIGLSGRRALEGRGMLFRYERDVEGSFWMKDTHVDLDIAFAGADFVVIEIRRMTAESLERVRPEGRYRYAVEAPAGWFEAHGVAAGDLLRLPPGLAAP